VPVSARRSRTAVLAATLALAMSWAAGAHADQASCFSAPVEGQKLRKAGKLLAARQQFLSCAQKECPDEIVGDCAQWASEVERALPSIVVAARDGAGHDLVNAGASIDGGAFAPIGTRAIKVDPGKHTVVVRTAEGVEKDTSFSVQEGEYGRNFVVTFGGPPDRQEAPASAGDRPVPPVVWVLGAVGGAGLLSFAVFGTLGVSARSAADCDVGCSRADKSDVDTKLLIADVSLGIGLVALGVATALYVMRPRAAAAAAILDVRPYGTGSAALGGRF
jgi:hypothetical protein